MGATAAIAPAQATFTFNVTNGNDAGPGSFRQAIADASNPLVGGPVDIVFSPGLHVDLTSGEVLYENVQDVSLVGNGSTLDGNNVDRIFRVRDQSVPVALSVDSLTFVNGELTDPVGGNGGALVITDGSLSITNSSFVDNTSAIAGGAVFAGFLPVTVSSSTFANNTSNGGQGGGAIAAGGTVTVTNSTFTANSAAGVGGAVGSLSSVSLTHVTMSGNTAAIGANVFAGAALTSTGSVLADPQGSSSCAVGSTNSSYSYDTDGSCGFVGTGDTSGGPDPQLGALGDNGGQTETMVPADTSPLVDAIPTADCSVATDQREVSRPQGSACDIGSVEVEPAGPPTNVPTSRNDCMRGDWAQHSDDAGRPFKNQGDCVSYLASRGRNAAQG